MFELHDFKRQLKVESEEILDYWLGLKDVNNGGFYCYANFEGQIDYDFDKAVLLHSRILWAFSAGYRTLGNEKYLEAAYHCYTFLTEKALDYENGGVYWMLDKNGNVTDGQKHVYNQGFAIYALSEFYLASGNREALAHAKNLFNLIEMHGFDEEFGGYHEAFDLNWNPIENHLVCDTSEGILAEKSMNTHLHILEAYTTLHEAWQDVRVEAQLSRLSKLMVNKIVDKKLHFGLFFTKDWQCVSADVSYGHDIEGTWLMDEAAGQLSDREHASQVFCLTAEMASVTLKEGLERDGAVLNELREGYLLDSDRIWWVQAEAMIGFFNAYQKSSDPKFLDAMYDCWGIIRNQLKDYDGGEWFWKVNRSGVPYEAEAKVEPWKCPYHNGRACLEVYKRIAPLEDQRNMNRTLN